VEITWVGWRGRIRKELEAKEHKPGASGEFCHPKKKLATYDSYHDGKNEPEKAREYRSIKAMTA
jgi:hypothetical protein